jgi:hypothetical protein
MTPATDAKPLVVLAASARALAECLRRAGLPSGGGPLLAVDAFGDDDLMAAVDGWHPLALADLHEPQQVVAAVQAVLQARSGAGCPWRGDRYGGQDAAVSAVYPLPCTVLLGGGFDGVPAVVDALSQRHHLLNSLPATWLAARDPLLFGRLGIAAPETRLDRPVDPRGWLRKAVGSSAGLGVGIATAEADSGERVVWQRRVAGTPASLLFCAHADGVLPIGLNRQWCSPTLVRPFRFGGVASGFDPGATARAQMLDAAARVSAETGLRGLCSLDVIVDRRGDAFALELNPRPTASAELYDRDAPGLLRLHLAAVAGGALPEWRPPVGSRALAVVYAPIAMCLGVPPTAVADWRRGAEVGIGDPLCTLHASGPDATVAMRRGRSSAGRLLRGLKRPARRGQNTGSAQ